MTADKSKQATKNQALEYTCSAKDMFWSLLAQAHSLRRENAFVNAHVLCKDEQWRNTQECKDLSEVEQNTRAWSEHLQCKKLTTSDILI